MAARYLEAEDRAGVFVPHAFEEHTVDLGEVRLNYAVAGDPARPALLLVPAQSESWWGYEPALPLLAEHFQCFAVDLRGQGRSTWTPGRYTLDNFGNDLVRFLDLVVGRPVVAAGNSSGGVLAAWLAAFAKPGQIRGAVLEDAPLFASEATTSCGTPIRQGMGPSMLWWNKWLGDQWSIGDFDGLMKAVPTELPGYLLQARQHMFPPLPGPRPDGPPQNLREYDPEWARAFTSGLATAACDHENLLSRIKAPVLFTHHWHGQDEQSGATLGAISDLQVRRARELVEAAGQSFTLRSFPDAAHSMHNRDPHTYSDTVIEWASALSPAAAG
ncbi:MAG TPA: alpha/beta hydrolase [Actinocrinis sp.]|nr:alpha/beta hydrolase [Actinocrinis sp.]